jgi:rsbT co-antagonist protein RsbR
MERNGDSLIPEILARDEAELLRGWVAEQEKAGTRRGGSILASELREQCSEVLRLLRDASDRGRLDDIDTSEWAAVFEMLADVSRARGQQGFSASETATFVLSLKRPLFEALRRDLDEDGPALARETWAATELLDKLALYTTEIHQQTRESVIARQQEEMLELSTPVVKLWDGILALPMIGTLDSARTQVVMEALLQKIVETGSGVAIIDITGVPTVDTLTAQHLLKTVTAARQMGADCIISGIRPQIAQTIVHLGVDLGAVTTKASMADAFALALQRTGQTVVRIPSRS